MQNRQIVQTWNMMISEALECKAMIFPNESDAISLTTRIFTNFLRAKYKHLLKTKKLIPTFSRFFARQIQIFSGNGKTHKSL